jgi:hypothetical protein
MKTLTPEVANEIKDELENIPEKFDKDFNSIYEGLAVILEEFEELKDEVFFGEKRIHSDGVFIDSKEMKFIKKYYPELNESTVWDDRAKIHKLRMRKEAIQTAAMCVRFIQELT